MEMDSLQLDREKFERVWSRVSPGAAQGTAEQGSGAKPPRERESVTLPVLLEQEREMRGIYGSLAPKHPAFEELWRGKERSCRALAAEHFLNTGERLPTAGRKGRQDLTPGNVRRWYEREREIARCHEARGVSGAEGSFFCERLREILEELM